MICNTTVSQPNINGEKTGYVVMQQQCPGRIQFMRSIKGELNPFSNPQMNIQATEHQNFVTFTISTLQRYIKERYIARYIKQKVNKESDEFYQREREKKQMATKTTLRKYNISIEIKVNQFQVANLYRELRYIRQR